MDTTNSSENPQRRVEDRKPAEVIDWAAPGAPAVPLSPAATSGDAPDLQQLKALALAATPGYWFTHPITDDDLYPRGLAIVAENGKTLSDEDTGPGDKDAEFIAAANPAVVLGLIARIENLEDGFKLALGALALRDHDEADRIGKQCRQKAVRIESAAAPAPSRPAEISGRLRQRASEAMPNQDDAKLMLAAADECDRFYGGMMAWKQTAEKKDRDWNDERMARVNERCAARAAAPATASSDELPELTDSLMTRGDAVVKRIYNEPLNPADTAEAASLLHQFMQYAPYYRRARAAVSAATKPTADLEVHNRIAQRLAWLENGTGINVPEFVADVQSLLATKPAAAPAVPEEVRKALQTVARWELPPTGKTWDDGSPMSYAACYGSNGERDYMRQVALTALAATPAASTTGAAQTAEQVRDQALEEAAEAMDHVPMWSNCSILISDAQSKIRALKRSTPTHSSEAGDA